MESLFADLQALLTNERIGSWAVAAVTLLFGLLAARLIGGGVSRMLKSANAHQAMIARRVTTYLIFGLTVASVLMQLGFDIKVLLGAAGIFTVAIGFASQTSASNIISGLFLLGERPFQVGDIITVGNYTGEVLSIDLLSVKLRTFDNLFVRLPNESIIKSEIVNMKRFPLRRVDIQVGVAYSEDVEKVREVLLEVAHRNVLCLEEPPPLIIFQGFGDSSVNHQFSVWTKRENFLAVRNNLAIEIKQAFERHGIGIPYPYRTLVVQNGNQPV